MEYKTLGPFPEECRVFINQVAAYQLHISDIYLSMACYYTDEIGMPPFIMFLEDKAEEKREQAKKLLRFLRKREGMICLPVVRKPDTDTWGTPVQALTSALQMENVLTKLLQDLSTSASETGETDLFNFLEDFQAKQKKNTEYLEFHISYQKIFEKRMQDTLSEMMSGALTSGEET